MQFFAQSFVALELAIKILKCNLAAISLGFVAATSQGFKHVRNLMQNGGDLGELITGNIAVESQRNRRSFQIAIKVALESTTKNHIRKSHV